jgi:Ca2+/Na+ antiporter
MDAFEITLRNDKRKFYDRFALFIFLLNGAGLILASIFPRQNISGGNIVAILFIFATVLMIAPSWIIVRKKKAGFENILTAAAVAITLFWIYLGYWWIGLVVFLLILLYLYSKRELVVKLNTERILYPSFPKKSIAWRELSNVMLKDRLLTIDFSSNRIIQQEIDAKSYAVKEEEFNDFCKTQLKLMANG